MTGADVLLGRRDDGVRGPRASRFSDVVARALDGVGAPRCGRRSGSPSSTGSSGRPSRACRAPSGTGSGGRGGFAIHAHTARRMRAVKLTRSSSVTRTANDARRAFRVALLSTNDDPR
ncbi:hypothetical protein IU11_02140 [Cellulosimicrobium sp. MM]|nr:hypothetical protein IU11_02140 [Cellulosimicrobium sp. MM]